MADEKEPKPVPADWDRHVERDLSWILNGASSRDERDRFATRIRDMVARAHTEWRELKEQIDDERGERREAKERNT